MLSDDVVVRPDRCRYGPSTGRVAWVWSMSAGGLVRRSKIVGYALLPLEWPLYAVVAAAMRDHLLVVDGAAVVVRPRRTVVRVSMSVVWPVLAAIVVWLGVIVAVTTLAISVAPAWLWILPVAAVVVGIDLAGDWALHPIDFAANGRRRGVDPGAWVAQLAAYPRGTGAGTRMIQLVCDDLDARESSGALVARRDLHEWYGRHGFSPVRNGALTLQRPARPTATTRIDDGARSIRQ